MSNPENPFDQTVWEPGGEHAIEDPVHGPSTVYDMLSVPPMPLGDGTYYQPGGFYAAGTPYFDALGAPLYQIGTARPTSTIMREMFALDEWISIARQGEEALTVLEARRQQGRLERNGAVHAFKSSDICGGGQRLDVCNTAASMLSEAQAYAVDRMEDGQPGEGRSWTTLAWLGKTCADCTLNCEVAVQTVNGKPTGITRLSNTKPLAGDVATIRIDPYKE